MRVKAIQRMYYNRRDYKPGETYDMDDREEGEAKTLALLGKIEILKEEKPAQPPRPVQTKVATPEPDKPPAEPLTTENTPFVGEGAPSRRYYRRRDLKAEE